MGTFLQVDDNNFDAEVLNSNVPVLVEFGAEWCVPCKKQHPVLEKFQAANGEKIKIALLDTDDCPNTSSKYKVKGVPTLLLFKNGQIVATKVGLTNLDELNKLLVHV